MARFSVTCWIFVIFLSISRKIVNCQDTDFFMDHPPLFDFEHDQGHTLLKDYSSTEARHIELPRNISYFGASYKSVFISKDGLISFDSDRQYKSGVVWSEGDVSIHYDKPFIAPFYYNGFEPVSASAAKEGKIYYKLVNKEELDPKHESEDRRLLQHLSEYIPNTVVNPPVNFQADLVLVVTWKDVTDVDQKGQGSPNCGSQSNLPDCKNATFQAVVVADKDNTFVIFNYLKMEIPISGDGNYQAGFNGGDRRGWYNVIPCQEACHLSLNSSLLNLLPDHNGSDWKGRYILSVANEVIIRGGCLPKALEDEHISGILPGTLEIYPREVGMFGGEMLRVSGTCSDRSAKFWCRFSYDGDGGETLIQETEGKMRNNMQGFCQVPPMSWKGPTKVSWSNNQINWNIHRSITVVLPSRAKSDVTIPDDVMSKWYSRDADTITVKWNPRSFSRRGTRAELDVFLVRYTEVEGQAPRFSSIDPPLGRVNNDVGTFDIDVKSHRCRGQECADLELGFIKVQLDINLFAQATEKVAQYYGPIPLGWYINQEMVETVGSDWSEQKCEAWNKRDKADQSWLQNLLPCPCSLDQALADFGRFQPDPGCNLYTGSKCHYHKGAKHCVRSVVPTPEGAGNQCCYNFDGTLVHSQLSSQGSTPDRGHVWGSHPYGAADRVPSLSHWVHDVVSYYHCCLWTDRVDLCRLYMDLRPTPDCSTYDVPGIGFLRGDPHIRTFDGQEYNFGGNGDFWLVNATGLQIQGRFENTFDAATPPSARERHGASALTMLAIKSGDAADVMVWPAPAQALHPRGLDVLVKNERRFFDSEATMWQDFSGGLSIVNNAKNAKNNKHNNFTILVNNVGVNVVESQGLLQVKVALPPSMKPTNQQTSQVGGLFGAYDGRNLNDFMSSDGATSSHGERDTQIYHNFAFSWKLAREESLFKSHKEALPGFTPYFRAKEIPVYDDMPSESSIRSVCSDNVRCQWDYKVTGNRWLAKDTKTADEAFEYVKSSAYRVDNCGLPEVGQLAKMDNYNFSVGQTVKVESCQPGRYFTNGQTLKCVKESLNDAEQYERLDYGYRREDPTDSQTYIIHWVPRPEVSCQVEDPESADIGLIIAIAVAALIFVVIVAALIMYFVKLRKKGSHKPKSVPRSQRGSTHQSEEANTMLANVQERSPVYKPSGENVRVAGRGGKGGDYREVRGSEV